MSLSRLLALCTAVVISSGGCRDKGNDEIAELASVLSGKAERSDQSGPWQAAAVGDRFRTGNAVRTSADGGARIHFVAGSGLRMGPSTTIRFGPGRVAVDGELTAEEDAVLELEVGRAEITAGSVIRIGRQGGEMRFDVLVGSAVVIHDQKRMQLTAGQALDIELGGSRVERVAGRQAKAPPDAGPPATEDRTPDAGPTPVAEGAVTGEVVGKNARARRVGESKWSPLERGKHDLEAGTEVSVPRGGKLVIARGEEVAEVRGAAELVVAPGGEDGALVETRKGSAVVRATGADVSVRVPGGLIIARRGKGAGSRADLRVDARATVVDVDSGVVDVQGSKGGKERLQLGQKGEIGRGGGLAVLGRPPDRADFSVKAGTTATIHDAAPPTDVRIAFGELCPGGGVLEVTRGDSFDASRRRVAGEGGAIVRLERGGHRYRVRCIVEGAASGEAVASGRLVVMKDAGTRPLPRQAPHNTVDADGRRYTVLYQNLLPSITFRWAAAPQAERYTLKVSQSKSKPIEVSAAEARHTMAAGKLAEGEYRFWFESSRHTSKKSILRIDFDNAAPTGYLQSPRANETWKSQAVDVSGAAAVGWKVSIAGKPLSLDHQRRFSTQLSRDPAENGIAVEFRHASRGVHLYVRRGSKR